MLIYYGWLNSFNSASHGWDNEKVAQELAQYSVLVFGDGIAASTHGDYANTKTILARIKVLNPDCMIFGYVSIYQTYANFKTKVDEWNHADIDVHGIFLDEAGYDYGTAATNGRDAFNEKVDYVHSKDMICFANAWKPEHVLDIENDASYPNTTWNPDLVYSNLGSDDWYLLESHAIDSSGNYESASQWKSRAEKALEYGLHIAACSVIADSDTNGQDKFDFIYSSAFMWELDAVSSSDTGYGATNSKSKMWTRPDFSRVRYYDSDVINISNSSSKYWRYLEGSKLELDFTSSSENSSLTVY